MFPSSNQGQQENTQQAPIDDAEAIEVVRREDWNALGPLSKEMNQLPLKEVYFTETNTKACSNRSECIEIVQGIQRYQMDYGGLTDINYNFLIGGDGRVYEGRGWFTRGPPITKRSKIPKEMEGKYIEIAFIGQFDEMEPTAEMQDAVNSLIAYGMENMFIEKDEEEAEEIDKETLENEENKDKDK